jgi:phosphoglycerate dehydrogenase-like enzyme
MDKPNIVVTYNASQEQQTLLLELLGGVASLTFLAELAPLQREQALEEATILLSWNFPREIQPQDYPRLRDQFTPNRMLSGMTAGILDYGGIGRATARLMRAFGMRIYAINTSGTSPEPADFLGTLHDLERVLRESDVVVVCLPLIRTTRGLIGKQELSWMKPDAILVNVARGALLDEEAIYTHVKSHPNFLLGIDAWWTEPFQAGQFRMEYPFLELPNVLGSPHNSGVVPGILMGATRQAAENVKRFLNGEQVVGIARREDYL